MAVGWILLYRSLQEHWLWKEKPFSRGQAWIDLIFTVNHENKKVPFDGGFITVKRGQTVTSLRKLSERWGWSVGKVSRFLNVLETDKMLTRNSDTKKTVLTIENYKDYQDKRNTKKTQTEHRRNTGGTQTETNKELIKNYIKNDKENTAAGGGLPSADERPIWERMRE